MVKHTFNPRTQMEEAGQPGLQSEFKARKSLLMPPLPLPPKTVKISDGSYHFPEWPTT